MLKPFTLSQMYLEVSQGDFKLLIPPISTRGCGVTVLEETNNIRTLLPLGYLWAKCEKSDSSEQNWALRAELLTRAWYCCSARKTGTLECRTAEFHVQRFLNLQENYLIAWVAMNTCPCEIKLLAHDDVFFKHTTFDMNIIPYIDLLIHLTRIYSGSFIQIG